MTETYVRTQVEVQVFAADPPEDWIVHSVWHHHTTIGGIAGPFDPDGHALNVANAFQHGTGTGTPFFTYNQRQIVTKVYNMDDLKPRPVIGTHTLAPAGGYASTALGPREIAAPLRYYAGRNLKSLRGRLFIGPWMNSVCFETFDSGHRSQLLDLAHALAAIGGANMSWCMHSEKEDILNAVDSPGGTTKAAWHDITHAWVNDQWAHMKSREHIEMARSNTDITPGIP